MLAAVIKKEGRTPMTAKRILIARLLMIARFGFC
jgi:hypothetical protein